ncbi:flagellar protein FlaG [Solemya pervernicosa gill symbiont]|uniref:flagellar protein FlaG n=1 Tax=Solemya pervernicosa gill symbiont TaxID=642797 RepID=UPI000996B406|nr:flagellar protein FlaG [Solemya pervernicosa gill symbiont]
MAAMTTQLTSLPPSVLGGKIDPSQEPRDSKSADAIDPTQVPGVPSPESSDAEPASMEELQDAVTRINDHMQVIRRNLSFNLDDESGETVIKVIDSDTDEVIRQLPTEEAMKLSKQLEQASGSLISAEA